jgi:hypothetical protein
MNYDFPIIETIHDVLPAIHGQSEFIIAYRDGFKVINYNVTVNSSLRALCVVNVVGLSFIQMAS